MAKRSSKSAEAVQLTDDNSTSTPQPDSAPRPRHEMVQPSSPETAAPATEQQAAEPPARQWRENPYPIKTVNLEGYKIQLQESRPDGKPWEMQIKFGNGSRDDMPSDAVRDFIKSQSLSVTKEGGEKKDYKFHWNEDDRAWGMTIASGANALTRDKAHKVFKDVVDRVAEQRGAGRAL